MMSKQFVFASCFFLLGALGCAGNESGSCSPACASTQVCCSGRCVFTEIDVGNCGACGQACSGTCAAGVCTPTTPTDSGPSPGACSPTCAADERCCGTNCVDRTQPTGVDGRPSSTEDPRSPFNSCNGCGLRCDTTRAISCSLRPGGSMPECSCGDFGECAPGRVCAQQSGSYLCVDTSDDTRNCGTIGNACAEGEACSAGSCVCGTGGGRCTAGQACCAAGCMDVATDNNNCGTCGNVCDAGLTCGGGECLCGGRACRAPTAGSFPTPGDPGETCCDGGCVPNDSSNCGGCGVVCNTAEDETCVVPSSFLPGGGTGPCCGEELDFIGGVCSGGFGLPDGGLPLPP